MRETEKKYLKWYQKIAYGAGDLASNTSYGLVSSCVLLYLSDTMGLNTGIIGTLMKIAAATLAAAGNPLALVVLLLFVGYCIGELILTTNMTYKKGRESIKTIMGSGLMQDVISGANVLAMFMMGAMTASMVTLKTVLKISTVVVQDKLDSIFPNVFPLIVLFLIYWLIRKKKVGTGKIVIGIIAVSILLSFVGIF